MINIKLIISFFVLSISLNTYSLSMPYCPQELCNSVGLIWGEDNREQILDTKIYPYSAIGQLMAMTNNKKSACTATLIGPNQIVTAAHCVYDESKGKWADKLTFYPGRQSKTDIPFEKVMVKKAYIHTSYYRHGAEFYDFALLELHDSVGEVNGWLGLMKLKRYYSDYQITIVGYPGDKELGTAWQTQCQATIYPQFAEYHCDTYGGMSGAALQSEINDMNFVIGVHNSAIPGANTGTVFGEENHLEINSWYDAIETKNTTTHLFKE